MSSKIETDLIKSLKGVEANALCLFLNAKCASWLTSIGVFNELAHEYELEIDRVGRRLIALGAEPLVTLPEFAVEATVAIASSPTSTHGLLELALENELRQGEAIKDCTRKAECALQGGCREFLNARADIHQRIRYFLRQAIAAEPEDLASGLDETSPC